MASDEVIGRRLEYALGSSRWCPGDLGRDSKRPWSRLRLRFLLALLRRHGGPRPRSANLSPHLAQCPDGLDGTLTESWDLVEHEAQDTEEAREESKSRSGPSDG